MVQVELVVLVAMVVEVLIHLMETLLLVEVEMVHLDQVFNIILPQ